MRRKIALKRLSASDLTLFAHHFRQTPGTKQKAFNLDRAVFIDEFFPSLPDLDEFGHRKFPVDVSIFGPGRAQLHSVQRKILKQQKNWRLDGELVHNPEDEPERYSGLKKNDLAIIEFFGETEPDAARIYLIEQQSEDGVGIFSNLSNFLDSELTQRQGMSAITVEKLASFLSQADLGDDHPLNDFVGTEDVEDAIQKGISGQKQVLRRRAVRGFSRDDLQLAKKKMEATGQQGEELIDYYLAGRQESGDVQAYKWVSAENAFAPYDFEVESRGEIRRLEVKSTSQSFNTMLHISLAELLEMAWGDAPYDLVRLYEVKDYSAKARITRDPKWFAIEVIEILERLPEGTTADSISVSPEKFEFGPEFPIDISD